MAEKKCKLKDYGYLVWVQDEYNEPTYTALYNNELGAYITACEQARNLWIDNEFNVDYPDEFIDFDNYVTSTQYDKALELSNDMFDYVYRIKILTYMVMQ